MIDVTKSKQEDTNHSLKHWKKNDGMKEIGFGKHLKARTITINRALQKPNNVKPTKFLPYRYKF